MIILLTGQPGHGKSQYAIKMILEYIKRNENYIKSLKKLKYDLINPFYRYSFKTDPKAGFCGYRHIYTDIDGINTPSVKPLKGVKRCPSDYRKTPNGSVFFYDECHKLPWVQDASGSLSKNEITISLNEHRHRDFDIILITQFPAYIHTHIRGLVEEHYHLKRFQGLKYATLYKWNEFILNPRTDKAMKESFAKEKFKFSKKYFQHYKSATSHLSFRFKFPQKLILPLVALVVIFSYAFYRYQGSKLADMVNRASGDDVAQTAPQNTPEHQNVSNQPNSTPINYEQPPLDELKYKYLGKIITTLGHSEDLRPAMVIASANHCKAYNTYGERLMIPDDICKMFDNDVSTIPRSRIDYTQQMQNPDTQMPVTQGTGTTNNPFGGAI